MAFLTGVIADETRRQEGCEDFLRQSRTDDARSQTQDIHIIVLDSLVGGIGIVAHTRIDTFQLVRSDARPHPGPAQQNPARGLTSLDGTPNFHGKIGIVIQRIEAVRSQVEGFVPGNPNNLENHSFERETGMVAGNSNLHQEHSFTVKFA
jgi:hypothetical protein